MFAATIISVAAFVAQAVASPVDSVPAPIVLKRTGPTVGDAAAKCGNGNVLACCNSGDKESNGGLIGDLPILGGNCNTLDVSVIGMSSSLLHSHYLPSILTIQVLLCLSVLLAPARLLAARATPRASSSTLSALRSTSSKCTLDKLSPSQVPIRMGEFFS